MLFEARGSAPLTLYFTYPIDEIDVERKKDWEKEQAKEIAKGKTPRPDWSAARTACAASSTITRSPLASALSRFRKPVAVIS